MFLSKQSVLQTELCLAISRSSSRSYCLTPPVHFKVTANYGLTGASVVSNSVSLHFPVFCNIIPVQLHS